MAGELRDKQRAFIEHYLTCWNATEAAKRAGYSERSAYSIGQENLKKPDIAVAIAARLADLQMGADEVKVRLTEQGRADIGEFVEFVKGWGQPILKLDEAQKKGKTHLIKSITPTRYGVKVELHDAQAALVHIGRIHAMFTDKQQIEQETTIVDITERLISRLSQKADAGGTGEVRSGD